MKTPEGQNVLKNVRLEHGFIAWQLKTLWLNENYKEKYRNISIYQQDWR